VIAVDSLVPAQYKPAYKEATQSLSPLPDVHPIDTTVNVLNKGMRYMGQNANARDQAITQNLKTVPGIFGPWKNNINAGGPVQPHSKEETPPPGAKGEATDTVPAMLAPDEYVIPKKIVLKKGTDFFDKLCEKDTGQGMKKPNIKGGKLHAFDGAVVPNPEDLKKANNTALSDSSEARIESTPQEVLRRALYGRRGDQGQADLPTVPDMDPELKQRLLYGARSIPNAPEAPAATPVAAAPVAANQDVANAQAAMARRASEEQGFDPNKRFTVTEGGGMRRTTMTPEYNEYLNKNQGVPVQTAQEKEALRVHRLRTGTNPTVGVLPAGVTPEMAAQQRAKDAVLSAENEKFQRYLAQAQQEGEMGLGLSKKSYQAQRDASILPGAYHNDQYGTTFTATPFTPNRSDVDSVKPGTYAALQAKPEPRDQGFTDMQKYQLKRQEAAHEDFGKLQGEIFGTRNAKGEAVPGVSQSGFFTNSGGDEAAQLIKESLVKNGVPSKTFDTVDFTVDPETHIVSVYDKATKQVVKSGPLDEILKKIHASYAQ